MIVGAITNGNADVWETKQMGELFDFAIKAEDAGKPKPSKEPFEIAVACCREVLKDVEAAHPSEEPTAGSLGWNVVESEIMHVGDCLRSDVHGAKQAGFFAIWINRGANGGKSLGTREGVETKPDFVVRGLDEIAAKL
uniref:Haloacid dehalogenase-like hydrolase domain-containing protein 3 n=2 Tax=Lotharella globosa TaxID=91324 RepID=A0A7S4DYN7_9EUKA